MAQRLLVSDLMASRAATILNICPTDPRFLQWLNSAESRLMNQGRWLGSVQEAQWCLDRSSCLVFGRRVGTVEQLAVCGHPIEVVNGWYPFTRILATLKPCTACATTRASRCSCGHLQLRMREGTVAAFATTRGAHKVLRSYPAGANDEGRTITFQGKDQYGVWSEEVVTLALPFADTTTVWGAGAPQAVVKDVTEGNVRVYEYDTSTLGERALANYEPGETRPDYVVGYVPHLADRRAGCGGCCTTGGEDAATTTITGLVSLQHVELRSPGDWLVLRNPDAYQEAMIAVKAYEEGDEARGNFHFYGTQASGRNARGVTRVVNRGGAIPLLQAELSKATGDRFNAYVYMDETDRFARQMAGFR